MTTCLRPLLLASLLLAAAALGCGSEDRVDVGAAAVGDPPPADASLAEAGWAGAAAWIDAEIDRSGRPVIVKFFASWCLPCRAEAPVFLDAAATHDDVAFLGIAHEDRREDAAAFVDEYGLEAIPTLLDPMGETARAVGGRAMPITAFVDRDGIVQYTHTGPIDHGLLEDWIAHLADGAPRPAITPPDVDLPEPS